MAAITVTVDGVQRAATSVVGVGPITDVVLGFHGSGASGATFLANWGEVAPGWAVVAADALTTDPTNGPSWVLPGLPPTDPYYPPGAPSDLHDLHLVEALVAYVFATWGPTVRIYVAGNSKGASLAWATYAFSLEGITAYWLAIFGAPLSSFYSFGPNAWGFQERVQAGLVEPVHVALWHGDLPFDAKSQLEGGADLWADSAVALGLSVGASSFDAWSDLGEVVGLGVTYPVRLRRITRGRKLCREYNVVDGRHQWTEGESAYARAFFVAASMPRT